MGPKASPSWPRPMLTPIAFACARGGNIAEMIVKAPFPMPEAPTPATALPTMNMVDDWAAPHNADPTTKMKKKDKKVHLMATPRVRH